MVTPEPLLILRALPSLTVTSPCGRDVVTSRPMVIGVFHKYVLLLNETFWIMVEEGSILKM